MVVVESLGGEALLHKNPTSTTKFFKLVQSAPQPRESLRGARTHVPRCLQHFLGQKKIIDFGS